MEQAAHQQLEVSSSSSSSGSSSSGSLHSNLVKAGVALHQSVLTTLSTMSEDTQTAFTLELNCSSDYANMHDALVETAAMHQVVAACSVMQQQLHREAQRSAEQQRGQQRGSDGAAGSSTPATASSSSSSSSGRRAGVIIPAFHEPLLPLLPGGQAFVDAVVELTGAAVAPNTQLQLFRWSDVGAFLLSAKSIRRCVSTSVGDRRIPPATVPVGEYRQLMLERQLLAAAFFQQWQQQQQQLQQQQSTADGRLREPLPTRIWKQLLRRSNSMLLEFTKITAGAQGGTSCLMQLLSGPDAPLPRALAVPLSVEGFWNAAVQHEVSSRVGEQLYVLKAALEAATGGGTPGEQIGSSHVIAVAEQQVAKLGMQEIVLCCPIECIRLDHCNV
jgi:hypothetical protein